ncbi:mediator of RNA polymerase II transcription subunit 20-like [Corticium candelabrum]|uniref:mediator of RNA polymerase II transcription subunit 20-like n=1 Tax=Corticium candelabrum TaxID=121492 RepID=UPI002E256756|nr:mediator of RNA polymerase II transcription subunit 20-like [Corticium candelabrum]
MGVTCVVSWPPPAGKTWSQAADLLQQRLELLGAKKTGMWSVDCEAYQLQSGSKLLHLVRNSEQPHACYGILDSGTCITTDRSFEQIMAKLGNYYQPGKGAHTEAKGQRYILGDNVVKVGAVTVGQVAKGLVVEVDFVPSVDPSYCWKGLASFVKRLLDGSVEVDEQPPVPISKDGTFKPIDTSRQYVAVFSELRAAKAAS